MKSDIEMETDQVATFTDKRLTDHQVVPTSMEIIIGKDDNDFSGQDMLTSPLWRKSKPHDAGKLR